MAKGKGENGGECKSRRLAQHAQAHTHILAERLDKVPAERFVNLFFVFLAAAKLDAGAALGIGAGRPDALEIVGAELDVRAELVVHIGADLRALEDGVDAEAKRGKSWKILEVHISSVCGPRADAMAPASRFQLLVSSRRRLRPAAVSE